MTVQLNNRSSMPLRELRRKGPPGCATLAAMRSWLVGIGLGVCAALWLGAAEAEKIDLGVLHRIKTEAFGQNSRVMDTLFYLTDVYGPRLTGSPNIKDAGNWTLKKA